MKPHTRALIYAFMRQTKGALAALEIFFAEEDRLESEKNGVEYQPKQPENQRTLRLPKNPK